MADSAVATFFVSCPRCLNRNIHCCHKTAGYDDLAIFTCRDCYLHFNGTLMAEHGRIRLAFRKLDCPVDAAGHRRFGGGGCFCECEQCRRTTESVYFTFHNGTSAWFRAELLPYQASPNTSHLSIYLPRTKGKSTHLCVASVGDLPIIACNGKHASIDIFERHGQTQVTLRKTACPKDGHAKGCCECECISCERRL